MFLVIYADADQVGKLSSKPNESSEVTVGEAQGSVLSLGALGTQ